MFIAILGRQPKLSMAELESVFGADNVSWFSNESTVINNDSLDLDRLGGTVKAGKVIITLDTSSWREVSEFIVSHYSKILSTSESRVTLGISAYNFKTTIRDLQQTGIKLKKQLKNAGVSLRLLPNSDLTISTASSHHNHLGLSPNKIELLIVKSQGQVIIAESIGTQNITAYTGRDQARPHRDAFVGMLPPKLAQMMINLGARSKKSGENMTLLDPFCGTGVILQEAGLMGYKLYGSDLSEKMVDYSRKNLDWLVNKYQIKIGIRLSVGDATKVKWQPPIDLIVCETYLGQPFSAPPSTEKLEAVKNTCNQIISEFLTNLRPQIQSGTKLCLAVPAWRNKNGQFTHLPLTETIARLGYKPTELRHVSKNDLLYFREDQVVARELLLLTA